MYNFGMWKPFLTSIIVMAESRSKREPTKPGSTFKVSLEDKSSLESVSICFKASEEQLRERERELGKPKDRWDGMKHER